MKPSALAVLRLLRERPEGITALEALADAGTFRLAARVGELRAEGWPVESRDERTASGARISRYRLVGQGRLWA